MPMFASPADVHYDAYLTNVGIAYLQDTTQFVASRIFPEVNVTKQSDRYYVWNRGERNRADFAKRAPSTESRGITRNLSHDTYFAEKWALHYDVSDEERANADPAIQIERLATTDLMFKGLLTKEINFATDFMKTGVWSVDYTGVASSPGTGDLLQWNDANSNPIEDIQAAATAMQLRTGGFRPNKLALSQNVRDKLVRHPDIIDLIKYGGSAQNPAVVTDQTLAAVLGIEQVLTMGAVRNSSAEGVAESNAFINSRNALLVYAPNEPSTMLPSAGYTFNWTGYMGNSPNGIRVGSFRMEHIKSDRIEAEMFFAQKVTGSDLGTYFHNIVAA